MRRELRRWAPFESCNLSLYRLQREAITNTVRSIAGHNEVVA